MFNLAIIDQQAVKLLRASVVITTLEQCLEELIKNALDAKATNIDIKVDIEKTMIQVCDNGVGIPSDHLLQIAQTHVTSKCHTIKDLYETKTFGYRGEVLAALANMSILQITSKYQDSAETYTAIWKDGCLIEHSIIQGKQKSGTIVTIPSLFCKYPVRRKYNNTSLDSLKYTTILFALIFPQVSFNLINSARNMIILTTKKCSTSLEIFQQLFGDRFSHAHSIHEKQFEIQGYFGNRVPTKVSAVLIPHKEKGSDLRFRDRNFSDYISIIFRYQ
ncbi:histidine kinase-like ATPase [Cunninghamella echinulata]|nr:histidine kinase-like ATPase [Cunninghamella echinulata]